MLTRIEVDGFKNLLGFSAEFGLFTCIAGPNAVGKSNLFDAIEFLSLLADLPVKEAAKRIRGGGDIKNLFWSDGKNRIDRMRFAVEMLTESTVIDDRGQVSPRVVNLYRYELELGLEVSEFDDAASRMVVISESLRTHLGDVGKSLRFPGAELIRDHLLVNTDHLASSGVFDGVRSPRTLLSLENTNESPRGMVVRREMQSWRRLSLDPAAIRRPDSLDDIDERMTAEGAHLPATLYRLARFPHDGQPPDPEGFYATLVVRVSDLIGLRGIEIDRDDKHRTLSVAATTREGGTFPIQALSDGTVRFLALATLSFAREQRLLCIEEPENGIHPSRMGAIVELLHDLATNVQEDLEYEQTIRQVIVNTHSPDFVKTIYENEDDAILMATQAMIRGPFGAGAHVLRMNPIIGTWRCSPENPGIGLVPLTQYLGSSLKPRK